MTTKTPGTGGTDQTATVEAGTIYLLRLIQAYEKDTARNPSGYNYLTSSVDEDAQTLSAQLSLPCNVAMTTDSTTYLINAIDYFTVPSGGSAIYAAGTGGTFKATTLQGALIQHILAQKNLELDATKNPTGAAYINYQVVNASLGALGNATFSATLSGIPLTVVNNSDGTQSTSGKPYLT